MQTFQPAGSDVRFWRKSGRGTARRVSLVFVYRGAGGMGWRNLVDVVTGGIALGADVAEASRGATGSPIQEAVRIRGRDHVSARSEAGGVAIDAARVSFDHDEACRADPFLGCDVRELVRWAPEARKRIGRGVRMAAVRRAARAKFCRRRIGPTFREATESENRPSAWRRGNLGRSRSPSR